MGAAVVVVGPAVPVGPVGRVPALRVLAAVPVVMVERPGWVGPLAVVAVGRGQRGCWR